MRQSVLIKLAALLVLVSGYAAGQSPVIEKVEPPNWWAGHSIGTVRVLVRGANLNGATVGTSGHSVKATNIRVNEAGDYLFFDLSIGKVASFPRREGNQRQLLNISVRTPNGQTSFPFEVLAPIKASKTQTITNDDVIYLIMTDRFADGDHSNNKGVDRKNPRAWHGGDFRGIVSKLDYLKELGITAIWLTPWYDNPDEANQCDKPWCPNTNYHGYHAIDYYGVENHFGSMADLQTLVREAHKKGIKVVQDQVANHVGIQHPWGKRPPLPNWFSPYSQNSFNNSVLLSPNASQSERDNLLKGWFNELLPDLNQNEPEVSRYLIQNALWWVGMTGIDGIRQDTIQYMPRTFIRDWSTAILKQYPKFYMVGEVFEEDSAQTAFFQGGRVGWDGVDTNLPSVFDFKLWRTSQEVFTGKKPARALRDVLKYDGLYSNVNNLTTLTNNHDTDRFMSLPGATLEGAMMHMAFILSTRGIPQIYYGEEIGMTGGHDPDNRKDFLWNEVPKQIDPKGTSYTISADDRFFHFTSQWIKLRKRIRALRYGKTVELSYDDDAYVFARVLEEDQSKRFRENSYAVVGFNYSKTAKNVKIVDRFFQDLLRVKDILKSENQIRSFPSNERGKILEGESGEITIVVPPKSIVLYHVDITTSVVN